MLHLGVIGVGFISQAAHLNNYIKMAGCKIVAASDLRPNLLAAVQKKYDIPDAYPDYHDLIRRSDIDGIIIVTNREVTAEVAKSCLLAKKNILTEKPMAIAYDTVKDLSETAKKHNNIYCIGYMRRFDPGFVRGLQLYREFCQNSKLGKLMAVQLTCYGGNTYSNINDYLVTDEQRILDNFSDNIYPEWLPVAWRNSYLTYLSVFCHDINLLHAVFPQGLTLKYASTVNPQAQTVFFTSNDIPVTLQTGHQKNHGWQQELRFVFETGTLTVTFYPAFLRNQPARVVLESFSHREQYHVEWGWAFEKQTEHFLQTLASKEPSHISAELVRKDYQLIDEIWCKQLES